MPPRDHHQGGGFAATRKAATVLLEQADKELAQLLTGLASPPQEAEPKKSREPTWDLPLSTSYQQYWSTAAVAPINYSWAHSAPSTPMTQIRSACGHTAEAGDNYCRQCGKRVKKVID